jgi:hypothetical protein
MSCLALPVPSAFSAVKRPLQEVQRIAVNGHWSKGVELSRSRTKSNNVHLDKKKRTVMRETGMKNPLAILPLLWLTTVAYARPVSSMPYDRLTAEADLIVVATPISVRDTQEKITLPRLSPPTRVVGVETTFKVLAVLKGDKDAQRCVLHHFRKAKPEQHPKPNGLGLLAFEPKDKKTLLLFLKREPDGRYAAVTGQADPVFSIKELVRPP